MKQDVLVVEYQQIFHKIGVKIIYQDENIFKRGRFLDKEIGVSSGCFPSFYSESDAPHGYWLKIQGFGKDWDDTILLATNEEAKIIKEKVKQINEKYGALKISKK